MNCWWQTRACYFMVVVLKKKRKLLRGTERLENKGFMNDLFSVYSKNDQNFKVLRQSGRKFRSFVDFFSWFSHHQEIFSSHDRKVERRRGNNKNFELLPVHHHDLPKITLIFCNTFFFLDRFLSHKESFDFWCKTWICYFFTLFLVCSNHSLTIEVCAWLTTNEAYWKASSA